MERRRVLWGSWGWLTGTGKDMISPGFKTCRDRKSGNCLAMRTLSRLSRNRGTETVILEAEDTPKYPQNRDLPQVLPPNIKKPYVRRIQEVLKDYKKKKMLGTKYLWTAPHNGMLIEDLIPLAHEVLKEYAVLEEGVRRLMESIPVKACTCCMEIHIARVGHKIPSCTGPGKTNPEGSHRWIRGYVQDVLIPIEAYHVHDKLGPAIKNEQRYTVPRVPAIHELCMHAGVDDPEYPMIRWARRSGRQVGDGQAQVPGTQFRNVIKPGFSDDETTTSDDEEDEIEVDEELERIDAGEKREIEKAERIGDGGVVDKCGNSGECEHKNEVAKNSESDENSEKLEMASEEAVTGMGMQDGEADENVLGDYVDDERMNIEAQSGYNQEDVSESDNDEEHKLDTLNISSLTIDERAEESGDCANPTHDPARGSTKSCELDDCEREKQELKAVAERTLVAFHAVRLGVIKLMRRYTVWACGYCPEVHIGEKPHKVKLCGGHKQLQRQGQHGWQEAALSDIFPPNFVWHVPRDHYPALSPDLRRYYGQAPAVVELCVQAGAEPPERWTPFMRMDVVIPEEEEEFLAA